MNTFRHDLQRKTTLIFKISITLILLLCLFFCVGSCSQIQPKICIKDGQQYCVTQDRIQVITWDACYRRGVNCMGGQCWEYAVEEFNQAIDLRHKDQRHARAYGMHFRDEYFPHRELGISLFRLGKIQESLQELELSMGHLPSARAKYYLNQVRRSSLLETGKDISPPVIHLDFLEVEYLTNQTPFQIKGIIKDDQYVSSISINQKPLFIELSEPTISFTESVDLQEGWNTIRVMAGDLVDRQTHQNINIYLDQQGPLVIFNPIQEDQVIGSDSIKLTAVVYDTSGIVSFTLNQKEALKVGLDQLCLVEQTIPLTPGIKTIPFWTQDRAGNISQGNISLFPKPRRHHLDRRLVCRSPENIKLTLNSLPAQSTGENNIYFDITHPQHEEFTTFYKEIFLEGTIEAQKGIQKIELNGKQLFNVSEIEKIVEKNRENLIQMLARQDRDIENYLQSLYKVVHSCNFYYLNQRIALKDEVTDLHLLVEDTLGNQGSQHYCIQRVPREEVLKSEQRMVLALLPLDAIAAKENTIQNYINSKLIESFISYGRFNLVEREKLPWVLIEKTIQAKGGIYQNNAAQTIGAIAAAEGVICGYIQRREDGTEILARFIEVETGLIRLFHDVFTPHENKENLHNITLGLAMKFRDAFPICTGAIIAKKRKIIRVDFGSEKGIFPGMLYNIFKDEQELIGKANIEDVREGFSEAKISERETALQVNVGYKVRTR